MSNTQGSTGCGINFMLSFLFYFLFVLIPIFCPSLWRLPAIADAAVRRWYTISDKACQDTVAVSAIPCLIRWVGRSFVGRSFARDGVGSIRAAVSVLPSGTPSMFPAQFACSCLPMSVPPPHSSSRVSADVLIRRFNHHPHIFVVPIVPPLYRISAHIHRVSAHRHPLRLCSTWSTVSFVSVIFLLTIMKKFRFDGAGTLLSISEISFYCFLFAISGDCQPMLPLVRLCVCSAGVGYHLQTTVLTVVCSMSYSPAWHTSSSLRHPIIYTSLCRPPPSLTALHI